ncbi:hypothetical protein [Rhizobium leguminosarum]|uniref:hypothetical protein n=1 Tax=Rhizobium leguminosarum TaxID=384 RepID=UPI001031F86F|nr:hypothetical protein [Rhizobium leguminosarum]TBF89104.1 hypothetical protein ELG82_36780 [Rhizobium leguminosarum]
MKHSPELTAMKEELDAISAKGVALSDMPAFLAKVVTYLEGREARGAAYLSGEDQRYTLSDGMLYESDASVDRVTNARTTFDARTFHVIESDWRFTGPLIDRGLPLSEQIDRGYTRPDDVSKETWSAAKEIYSLQLTEENTPEWYLRGGSPEDEEFYDAMRDGISFESREAVVAALRDLREKGQEARVVEGWTSYTLNKEGTEVFEQNHNPDGEGDYEHWDANDPERTIWSNRMAENEHYEQLDAEKALGPELVGFQREQGVDVLAALRETPEAVIVNGISFRMSAENRVERTAADGSSRNFPLGLVEYAVEDCLASEKEAAPAKDFDLTSMMAATAKPIDDGRTVPDAPTGAESSSPPQRRGPDFSTAPAPKKKPEDEKLTSQMVIIQLNDFDTKPKLATDEIARRGAGVAVTRKAYRVDGTEIAASYEFTKGGKVLHTGYDGKQTEMTFEQAKRHEIAEINLLNRNAIIAINQMATDPKFSLRQGDATFSVMGNFFVRTKDDGTVTKEPLAETQKRFSERGREIRAMGGPELDPKPPTNAMQAVQPKPEKTQRFARMADRADAAAAHENKSGKTLESGNQLGA